MMDLILNPAMSEPCVAEDDPALKLPMIRSLIAQLRAMDTYGTYDKWSDARVVDPLVLTRERRRELPVIGDPDEIVVARVKAFYNAVSMQIEQACGLMASPLLHLSHEGFGSILIRVGKLVVLDRSLRDVHRFGFASLEKLNAEAEKIVQKADELVSTYREVAGL